MAAEWMSTEPLRWETGDMTARTAHRVRPASRTRWSTGSGFAAAREDLLLGGVVGFAGLLEISTGAVQEHRIVASACLLGMATALVFRRAHPLVVLVAVMGLFLVQSVAGVSSSAQLATD